MNDNKNINKTFIDLSTTRVLIVEDLKNTLLLVRNMLASFGIRNILEAHDGRKALNFIDNAQDMIDVIICDWNIPDMSGLELLRHLRNAHCDINFLMIMGQDGPDSVTKTKLNGAIDFIVKPFSPDQLEVKIRTLVYHQSQKTN